MEAFWWERLRKLGLILIGRAMFSKSLIQFSVDGWGCIPSLLFGLRPNCLPKPPPEIPRHSQRSLTQFLVGTLLLSPCSWYAQGFVCALQEFPQSCVSSVIKSRWPPNSLGFSVSLPDPQVGKSMWVLEFLAVWEFIGYNCSALCWPSVWWLYGGVNGNLLQEGLCHRLCKTCLLHPEPLPLPQATADPYLCGRHSKEGLSQSL